MLIILDVNTLISAVLTPRGPSAELIRAVRRGDVESVVSPTLLAELRGVLSRPKFRRYASVEQVGRYVAELEQLCRLAPDPPVQVRRTRDPDDEYLIALALSVSADLLVSGDKDLLDAGLRSPVVVTPRQAVERLS